MARIVQCVPNFSEGRDLKKIEDIVSVLKNKKGFKSRYMTNTTLKKLLLKIKFNFKLLIDLNVFWILKPY